MEGRKRNGCKSKVELLGVVVITVIANYRTGSSTFIKELSDSTGLKYPEMCTGEYLYHQYQEPSNDYQIYKIMPDQVQHRLYHEIFYRQYIKGADVIYLCRRNLTEQIISYINCVAHDVWHPVECRNESDWFDDVLDSFDSTIDIAIDRITDNYERQHEFYKKWPGQVLFLEDRFDENQKYPKRKLPFTEQQLLKISSVCNNGKDLWFNNI